MTSFTAPLSPIATRAPLHQLQLLTEALAEAVRGLGRQERPPSALGRLLAGEGAPEDLARLGVPIPGCRLMVAELPPRETLMSEVRGSRMPYAWHEGELVLLVAEDRDVNLVGACLRRHGKNARIGVSSRLSGPGDLARAFGEARQVRDVMHDQIVPLADEHWAALSLERLRAHLGGVLPLDNPILRLADVRPDFVDSLRAWLRFDRDVAAAAAATAVHANTLRYRVRRVQELTSLDLDDPTTRVLAMLILC